MKRIKMILLALVATVAFSAMGASVANAGYFTGSISGSNWLGTIDRCNFAIDAQKANPETPPPAAQTLLGASFRGNSSGKSEYPPCDPEDLELSNINVTFEEHTTEPPANPPWALPLPHWDAILGSGFTVSAMGCTFTATSSYRLHQTGIAYPNPGEESWGWYQGTGSASGSPFFCGSATINLFEVKYHPNP